jgi:hypothetical protein
MDKGDLHIHTSVSDGALSPADAVLKAVAGGLDFFAITDHNSLGAIPPAQKALLESGPRFICGVELSAQPDSGQEIHILGYGFRPDCAHLQGVCREICALKREQIREIIRRLGEAGVDVDLAALRPESDDSYIGRPLLAGLLIQDRVVATVGQAFVEYLGSNGKAFVPMKPMDPRRCIEAIHRAGGLAVLAHPTIETVDRWIERLAAMGLDGMEVYRPGLRGNEQLYVEKAAQHFGLLATGGSDWHGRDGEQPLGAFSVDGDQVEGFLAELDSRSRP